MNRNQRFYQMLDTASEFVQYSSFFKDDPEHERYHIKAYSHIDIDGSSKVEFDVTYHAIDNTSEDYMIQLLKAKLLGIDSYPAAVEG